MPKYILDINNLIGTMTRELEFISVERHGKPIVIAANDTNSAAMQVARALVPVFEANLKEVGEEEDARLGHRATSGVKS